MNKLKKMLSILLCLLLFAGFFTAGVLAAEVECEHASVNDSTGICADCQTQFAMQIVLDDEEIIYALDFEAAMDDLTENDSAEKAVVTLYKDAEVTSGSWIRFAGNGVTDITINLNGHKISHPEDSEAYVTMFIVSNGEKFTVMGEGSIVANACAFEVDGATLIVNGADITSISTTAVSLNNAKFEAKDATITSNNDGPLYIDTYATAKLENCVVTAYTETSVYGRLDAVNTNFSASVGSAIDIREGGKVTLTGCKITGIQEDIMFAPGAESLTLGDGVVFPGGMRILIIDAAEVSLRNVLSEGCAFYDKDGSAVDITDEDAVENAHSVKYAVIGKDNISLEYTDVVYDGNVHIPAVTVTVGGITLEESLYEVICDENSNVGTYEITVSGKGVVTGEGVVYYSIMPDTTALDGITKENVTTENEDVIREIVDSINNSDEETKKQWSEILDKCEELLGVIEDIQEKAQSAGEILEDLTTENVKPEDKEEVNAAIKVLEELMNSGNITAEEKTELENAKKEAEKLIKAIEEKVLATLKSEAVEMFREYVDQTSYRQEQVAQIEAIAAEAQAKINAATTPAEVAQIIADTKSKIDAIPTDEELKAEEYVPGDVDGNGTVEAKDVTQILRYINGKTSIFSSVGADTELLTKIADVDGNGEVEAKDATQMLRYVNGKASVLDK